MPLSLRLADGVERLRACGQLGLIFMPFLAVTLLDAVKHRVGVLQRLGRQQKDILYCETESRETTSFLRRLPQITSSRSSITDCSAYPSRGGAPDGALIEIMPIKLTCPVRTAALASIR